MAKAPPYMPWVKELREKIAAMSSEATPSQSEANVPRQSQEAAIAAMPAPEQNTAIRGMVDRLAARLAQNGQDIEGWLRLVRAYKVLNEADKARTALDEARRNLGNDPAATARIDALAHELGLEG